MRSTLELAKNLNIEVIAEGIQAVVSLQALKAMRCYGAQGFLFSAPLPASNIPAIVQRIEATRYELD